jgi:hypothetical protein
MYVVLAQCPNCGELTHNQVRAWPFQRRNTGQIKCAACGAAFAASNPPTPYFRGDQWIAWGFLAGFALNLLIYLFGGERPSWGTVCVMLVMPYAGVLAGALCFRLWPVARKLSRRVQKLA